MKSENSRDQAIQPFTAPGRPLWVDDRPWYARHPILVMLGTIGGGLALLVVLAMAGLVISAKGIETTTARVGTVPRSLSHDARRPVGSERTRPCIPNSLAIPPGHLR